MALWLSNADYAKIQSADFGTKAQDLLDEFKAKISPPAPVKAFGEDLMAGFRAQLDSAGPAATQDAMAASDAAQPAPVTPEPAPAAPEPPAPEQQAPPEQPMQPTPSHVPTQQPTPDTGVPTTADISNPVQGNGSPSMGLGDIYKIAIDQGLGEDGARVATAIAKTEGGLNGAAGDGGLSFGPFQFYGGGGQLNNYAKQLGMSIQQAGEYVRQHPGDAAAWALQAGGYLGDAIRRGAERGFSGAELATYAQNPNAYHDLGDPGGQVSVSPERAGQNYQALWAGGGTAASLPVAAVEDFLGKAGQAIGTGLGNAGQAVGDTLGDVGQAALPPSVPAPQPAKPWGEDLLANFKASLDTAGKTVGDTLGNAGQVTGNAWAESAAPNAAGAVADVAGAVGNAALETITSNPYTPLSQVIHNTTGKGQGIPTDEEVILQAGGNPADQSWYQVNPVTQETRIDAARRTQAGQMFAMGMADAPIGVGGIGKAAAPLGKAAAEVTQAPFPLQDIPLVRYQNVQGEAATTGSRGGIWFSRATPEESTGYQVHGPEKVTEVFTPSNPLVLVDAQAYGAGDATITRLASPVLKDQVDKALTAPNTGSIVSVLQGLDVPDQQIQGILKAVDMPMAFQDRVATELASNAGYDSIIHTTPNGRYTEVVKLSPRPAAAVPPIKPPAEPPVPAMGAEPPGGMPPGASVPSPMGKLSAAATGTAEQAAQLRPVEPGFAGNVKLAKFQPDIQPLIQQTMDENSQLAGMRRGVVTDAAAKAGAVDAAQNTSIEAILGKAKPGKAYTQEEVLVLGDTITRTGNEYNALNTTYQAALKAGTDTPAMKIALAQKALQTSALVATRAGAASSAGRALRAFTVALTGEAGAQGAAISKAFKVIGGGDAFDKWLVEFNAIPPENLAARYNMMQGLAKPTIWDKLNYLRYNSMLSSYKTHMNNMASQAGTTLNPALELAASGHPGEAGTYLRTLTQGIPDAIAGSVDLLRQGATPEQMLKMDVGRPNPFGTGIGGRIMGLPTDLLGAEDHFFQSISYGAQLRLQAERLGKTPAEVQELMANPTDAMAVRAKDAAQRATYTENPGEFVTGLMDWTNTHGPGGAALKFLVPFVRVPANIFHRGISMTLQPVTGPVKVALNLAKGNTEAAKLEAGRTAIAGTFGLGFAALAVNGRLTGAGPVDPARRKLLEASGWQSHSLDVSLPGSKPRWIDYTNFGTISVPMATIAAAWEGAQDAQQKPKTELAADVTSRIAKILIDTSYIKGIGQIFQIASTGVSAMPAFVSNIANTLIPYGGLGAAVERIVDPATRATDLPGASVASRLPGLSGMLPAQVGPYGKPQTTGEGDTLAQIALPWRTSTERPDPVAKEVARLISLGQSVPVRTFGEQYAGAKQTPEQQRLIQTQAGQMAATYLADYISRPEYAKATDAEKAKTLTNAIGTAYQLADLKLGDQVARDPKYLALQSWANVPHYETVKGTPEQIRVRNFEIAQAYAKLAEYRKQYGTDLGEVRLLKADPGAWKLTQLSPLDSDYLAAKKKVIDKMFGGALTQATTEGLIGAGNTVLTPAAAR